MKGTPGKPRSAREKEAAPRRSPPTPPRIAGARGRKSRAASGDRTPDGPPRAASRHTREVRLLLQATHAIHRTLRRETVLRSLVRAGMKLTGATAGAAGVMEGDLLVFSEYVQGRSVQAVHETFRIDEFVPGHVMRTLCSYVSNEPARDPRVNQGLRRSLGFYNLLCTPILARNGRLLGCFELHNTADRRPFDEDDVRLLHGLAQMAAIALTNSQVLAERGRARSALDLAHRESEGMFEGIQQPALVLNADHVILAANRAMTRVAGRSRLDLIGRRCSEIVRGPEDGCSSCPRGADRSRRPHAHVTAQRTIGNRTFLVSCLPIRDAGGKLDRIFQVATDITERKRIDQELAHEQERARSYLQIAAVMIVAIDPLQKVTLANRRACEILGYPEEEIMGRNWFDRFVPERHRERVRAAFATLMRGELEPIEYFENPVLTRGGQERIIAWHNAILYDAEGRISGTLSSGTDVTESRRADRELRALNETLEERVAERTAVAEERTRQLRILARELTQAELRERQRIARLLHEHFQQQLAAARVHLGLLARESLGDRQHQLLRTVDGILQKSIEDSRSLAIGLCPPVLYELGLGPAVDWLAARMLELHGLRVQVEDRSGRDPVDPNLRTFLFEAVQELLFNVIKHARAERATVTLRRQDGDLLCIDVTDGGIGFRIEQVPPAETDGAAFGLFSIRERLASLGGWTEVVSAPGRGTRVTLCAPLAGC